jgi:hypothetical protein
VTLLLPGATFVDLGPDGGPYDETHNPKAGWHTWEGLSWAAAQAAFAPYPPHLAAKAPFPGVAASEVGVRQYVSLDRHSYAFKGSENDDEYIIQIELAGRAAQTHDTSIWTPTVIEWIAKHIVVPLETVIGIPRAVVAVGFHGADEGISPPLATTRSPIRLNDAELRAFTGHLGHQHMPPPDVHWDPGRFQIDAILAAAGHLPPEDDMPLALMTADPNHQTKWPAIVGAWFKTGGLRTNTEECRSAGQAKALHVLGVLAAETPTLVSPNLINELVTDELLLHIGIDPATRPPLT